MKGDPSCFDDLLKSVGLQLRKIMPARAFEFKRKKDTTDGTDDVMDAADGCGFFFKKEAVFKLF